MPAGDRLDSGVGRQMTDAVSSIYNYRSVSAELGSSGQPSEAQLAAIAGAGYEVVINLALHDDPRYSLADEAQTVGDLGMEYVHIPVRFEAPTKSDLLAFLDAMARYRSRKIWLHCAANIRVTAFLGLYRVLREGWEAEPAFELMHGMWEPNQVWSAFIAERLEEKRDA